MDNPNKRNPPENIGKAGFFTRMLAKLRDKKLSSTNLEHEEGQILSTEEVAKWEKLGRCGYTNDDEMRLLLLHVYRERARKNKFNISIREWRTFKAEAVEVLKRAGFDEEEARDDIEKWRVIDDVNMLNEQERIFLEIHKQRQKALEKGQEGT